MMITYIKFFCQKQYICHSLESITGLRAVLKGSKKGSVNTLRYVLFIYLDEGEPVRVMGSKNEQRIKKQLLILRKFLDIEGDRPIEVVSNATMEYEEKSFGKKVVETMKKLRKPVVTANGSYIPPINKRKKEANVFLKAKTD